MVNHVVLIEVHHGNLVVSSLLFPLQIDLPIEASCIQRGAKNPKRHDGLMQ